MFSYEASEASLYEYVHYLTQAPPPTESQQRAQRQSQRKEFRAFQNIAAYENGCLPSKEALYPVRCLDLARGGFSFITTEPLDAKSLVVALGTPPRVSYVSAEVMHQTQAQIIGCRFTGKLEM